MKIILYLLIAVLLLVADKCKKYDSQQKITFDYELEDSLRFLKNSANKDKLFLEFWSGMTKEDYNYALKRLINNKSLVYDKDSSLMYTIYIDNKNNYEVNLGFWWDRDSLNNNVLRDITLFFPRKGDNHYEVIRVDNGAEKKDDIIKRLFKIHF